MFQDPKPDHIPDWICVLEHTDSIYVDMVKAFLNAHRIPSQILSKRDRAYSLNIGLMSQVYLYVPAEYAADAETLINEAYSEDNSESN